ncbi:1-acyl-sn-glycerol-3-phosphate acyltransferase [Phormidium sp. FACHB-592]|uniref:1-acyl-sn-glycerol-3-phosphate acyltransferase n=1 Tax=Stenomitos frigidus AS-A4 TaxID=2933935 RepID=A0ABV0KMR5_9CYAN|nr:MULTISPECIES: lysophospholipid acyltransferase family protein [Cyanophyceae]MBD2035078.1 1-acyl-sn-glycerol-3-phosphate acyltransferase [Leptolyngbya sp. FACHB-321]MBD2074838.1 1-acyl-sn-glycerol-3-phosphate acyltransferase [Phormidium sp. FACHB-592]
MPSAQPLQLSRLLLAALGIRLYTQHQDRIPQAGPVLLVSNHRSFLDAPLLMAALNRPIRFACHHYMGQVPVMRDIVEKMGCFPLDLPEHRQQTFFNQAVQLLQSQQVVGLFPEGAEPMVKQTLPKQVGVFQRGFAHLALRAPVQDLVVLPVAIVSDAEATNAAVPLRLLSFFDPSEPLFSQEGWHPMVIYQRVNLLVGRPQWISPAQRQHYQGKQAKALVTELTQQCRNEIDDLLRQGSY